MTKRTNKELMALRERHVSRGPLNVTPISVRMPYAYCYRCPFGLEFPSCQIYCADYLEDFFINNVAAGGQHFQTS